MWPIIYIFGHFPMAMSRAVCLSDPSSTSPVLLALPPGRAGWFGWAQASTQPTVLNLMVVFTPNAFFHSFK